MKNKKITKKNFLDWIEKYSSVVVYHISIDKTETFLDVLGNDGGDVTKTGLKDYKNVIFDKPETVDNWHTEIIEVCNREYLKKFELPEISFTDYCKNL